MDQPSFKHKYQPLSGKGLQAFQLAGHDEYACTWNIWEGAVRSSKTIGSILMWIKFVRHLTAENIPGNLLMVGKTRDTIERNVIDPILDMLGRRALWNRGTGVLTIVGRKIFVVGANDAQAESKIRGLSLVGAYGDELTLWPEAFFKMLGTRLSEPGARFFGTTNPDNPRHWLMADYLKRARVWLTHDGTVRVNRADSISLARYSFQLDDNPWLAPEYLERLKLEYAGLWRKRFILGQWVMAEGAVYDMWDEDKFVIPYESVPKIDRMFAVGIDYGTTNPFAAIKLGIGTDPADGVTRMYALDQWRWDSKEKLSQRSSVQYAEAIKAFIAPRPPEWVVVDPAAADFRLLLFQEGVQGVMAGDNAVAAGIRSVTSLLARDRLRVTDRCTGLIETFPGYAWDDAAALRGEDKPLKVGDHDLDALRYPVHTLGYLWRHPLQMTDMAGAERDPANRTGVTHAA